MYRDACAHLQPQRPSLAQPTADSVLGDATNLVTPPARLSSRSRTAATAVKTDQGKLSTRARAASNAHHTTVRQPRPSRCVSRLCHQPLISCVESCACQVHIDPQCLPSTACGQRLCVHWSCLCVSSCRSSSRQIVRKIASCHMPQQLSQPAASTAL